MSNIITNIIIHYGVGYVADVASTFLRRAEYRPSESEARAARSIQCFPVDLLNSISNFLTEREKMSLLSLQKTWRPLYLKGATVLLAASATGTCEEKMKFAIQYGLKMKYGHYTFPSINARDLEGVEETLLHHAMESYDEDMIRVLLEHKADVDAKDSYGNTPLLSIAASSMLSREHQGKINIMSILLNSDANSNVLGSKGRTPLHYAVFGGAVNLVKMLLLNKGTNINAKDDDGETPLWYAVRNYNTEIIKLFMEHGANPNFRDFFYAVRHNTPLKNYLDLFDIFLEKWAVDINAQDESGDTLLHFSACCRRNASAQITELVLAKGANVNARNEKGMTPLHEAICGKTAKLLLESGADINAKDNEGGTPLHYATKFGEIDISTILLQNGATD